MAGHAADSIVAELFPGKSAEVVALRRRIAELAEADGPVLVYGEPGSGHERVACALHLLGTRRPCALIRFDCADRSETEIELALFGCTRGPAARAGLLDRADGGVLCLTAVEHLSTRLQERLLGLLVSGRIERLDGSPAGLMDVRLVLCTSHHPLALARRERLLSALLLRLKRTQLELPPLWRRPNDVRPTALAFLRRLGERFAGPAMLSEPALDALERYDWPLNLEQLEDALCSAWLRADGGRIELAHLPEALLHSVASRNERPSQPCGA